MSPLYNNLALVVLLSFCSSVFAQFGVDVDRDNCNWRGGDYGDTTSCLSDEIAVGSCGSGKDPDCADSTFYDTILCCPLDDYRYVRCTDYYAEYGEKVSCPVNTEGDSESFSSSFMEAICGSGRDDDCNGYSHMVRCCAGEIGTGDLYTAGDCYWQYASFGIDLECDAEDEAAVGRCGSGRDGDCEATGDSGGYWHALQCCRIVRV